MFFPGLKDKNTVVGQDESRTTANTKGAGGGGETPNNKRHWQKAGTVATT